MDADWKAPAARPPTSAAGRRDGARTVAATTRVSARATSSPARSRRLLARLPWRARGDRPVLSIALVAPVESASVLAGAGGVLTAVGRVAGHVRDVPVARHPAADREDPGGRAGHRPGPPRQAAPQARTSHPRPRRHPRRRDRPGLRRTGCHRSVARAGLDDHDVPGHDARRRRAGPALAGRVHLLSLRPAQDEVRDLVGRPPLHIPGRRAVDPPPDPDRRAVHRSPAGHRLVADAVVRHRRRRHRLSLGLAHRPQPAPQGHGPLGRGRGPAWSR